VWHVSVAPAEQSSITARVHPPRRAKPSSPAHTRDRPAAPTQRKASRVPPQPPARAHSTARASSAATNSSLPSMYASRSCGWRGQGLEGLVARRLVAARAQVVPHRDVAKLVLASPLADVQVMGARTLRGPGEEVMVGRLGRGHEEVAERLEGAGVADARLELLNGELKIEDRLGGEAWNRRRAHVLEAHRRLADGVLDAAELRCGEGRPGGVVFDDADRGIEAVVQRRMPLEPVARIHLARATGARATRPATRCARRSRPRAPGRTTRRARGRRGAGSASRSGRRQSGGSGPRPASCA
jgi:hypothetical protein